ncbi:MAG: CPBP family intramembrane metalloprotease [Bacillota bacterium]|nr:CPBP family intramembrane metalloprotease [Bacillota bacterium]
MTKDWLDAGFKPAVRKNALWYIICILAYPLLTVVMLIIGNIYAVSSISEFSVTSYLKTFLTALPVFLVFSIFEEFGWRGYLVPKLASTGINDFLGYAIVAVVWASWHLPYIRELSWVYTSDSLATFFPRFHLSMFAFSILYSEVRIITGSVWPAVLMHCISNSFAHPLLADYVKITQGKEYLISSTGLIMTACIGLLGIILNRWRVKNEALLRME